MSQQSFDLTPGQNIVNYNLHFAPLSAVVDNMTPYWVRLPDAGRYIPPYSTGGSVPLINAMGGTVLWEAPAIAGIAQIPFITDAGVLHITFVDEVLSYSPPAAIPDIAFNNSDAFSWNVGTTLNQSLPFLAIGTRIDNPSGTAYTISGTGLIIPPWTLGWTVDILPPYNTIQIAPIANPTGQSNVARGGPLTLTAYSGKIGISPGITSTVIPSNLYTFTSPIAGVVTSITNLWLLDNIASGSRVRLNELTFINPGVSQVYSIYAVTPGSLAGTLWAASATPTPLDSNTPAFPGSVYSQSKTTPDITFKSITYNDGAAGSLGGSVVLPSNLAATDILLLAIRVSTANNINAFTGWTLVKNATLTNGNLFTYQKNVVSPADSGTTLNFTFSGGTPAWQIACIDYGTLAATGASGIVSNSTSSVTYAAFANGTASQITVLVIAFNNGTYTFGAGYTQRLNNANSGLSSNHLAIADNIANNTAAYTPPGGTPVGLIQNGTVDINFTVTATMSFTTTALYGSTASVPSGATTVVNVRTLIGDIFASTSAAIGIIAPANTAMTINGKLELA